MVKPIPAKVPAPAELIVSYKTLITDTVQRSVCRCNADNGVRTALPCTPMELPNMHALCVTNFPSYAVCTLCNRMSVKRQFVILLQSKKIDN